MTGVGRGDAVDWLVLVDEENRPATIYRQFRRISAISIDYYHRRNGFIVFQCKHISLRAVVALVVGIQKTIIGLSF